MIRNGQPVHPQGYVTDIITDTTIDWLQHRDPSRPFLLMCQHKAPHRGWEPALRHLDADGGRQHPEPPTLFDDYAGRGIAERDQDMMIAEPGRMGMNERDLKLVPPTDLNPEQRQVGDACYEPRNAAFRAARLSGRALVSNLDFAETFLEAAGVAIPSEMQGRSLVPLLHGRRPADWRSAFYYHDYEHPYPHHVRPHYGVVTERYKLVHFYGTGEDYDELFDLADDPRELRSVYGEPGYADVQARLMRELARLRKELRVPDEQASPNR